MSGNDDAPNKNRGDPPGGPRWQGIATALVFAACASVFTGVAVSRAHAGPTSISYSALVREIEEGYVQEVVFAADEREVYVRTRLGEDQEARVLPSAQMRLADLLMQKEVPFSVAPTPGAETWEHAVVFLATLAPLLMLVGFALSLGRGNLPGGMGMFGGNAGGQGNLQMEPETGTTFADVAGCDGSKLELTEVVDFLKAPGKYAAVGAITPKGVLLEGPPGTGKTLLARAVAGEAGVPFISASGSEFVEMFVGVGASRIRNLFARAKQHAPCIVFIDEIDAVGKARAGSGSSGSSDERDQTLNQILTEMDGFDKNSGVIVIAATNRADVLDPALLRAGRFDRRVPVDLPDRKGRHEILVVHARNKVISAEVDLDAVAARTTGFSGAALANLMNEAAIVTARRDKLETTMSEVEYALERITVGLEKRTGMADAERKRLVAYHEAGHAVMGALTPGFDAVGKVTIVPRSSGAGGFTLFVPSESQQDSGLYPRHYLEAQLAVALGGRVAEELIFGPAAVTTGAAADLQRVADIARKMVTQWGFAAEDLGPTAWEAPGGYGWPPPAMASEATQERIDKAVEAIVRRADDHCRGTLTKHRPLLDDLADQLVERETVGNDDLQDLMRMHGAKAAPLPWHEAAFNSTGT